MLGSKPQGGIGSRGSASSDIDILLAFAPEDINTTIHRIHFGGGTVKESEADSEHGRWVECTDDQGTRFALYARIEQEAEESE